MNFSSGVTLSRQIRKLSEGRKHIFKNKPVCAVYLVTKYTNSNTLVTKYNLLLIKLLLFKYYIESLYYTYLFFSQYKGRLALLLLHIT